MQETENQAIENTEISVDEPINEVESSEEVTKPEEVAETEDKSEGKELAESDDTEDSDDPFPKKATRALERRNKKINKLRAEKAELERQVQEFRARPLLDEQVTNTPDGSDASAPQEGDFDDYAEYLKATGAYDVEQKYAAKAAEAEQNKSVDSQRQWVQERAKYVNDRAAKTVETIPELDGLYRENQDIIEGYMDDTKMAFLEAEKPELAFYALAKEGRLEELDGMSPSRIAREIALAEIRGEKMSKARPVTKAPAPIKPVRGGGARPKSISDMSPSQLLEYLKKQKRN